MNLEYSAKTKELIARCQSFMRDVVYPNEHVYLPRSMRNRAITGPARRLWRK
jgi:hypothetical protein